MTEISRRFFRSEASLLFVFCCAFAVAGQPLFAGADRYMYYSDDLFYYLKIAQNIVEFGKSTFDGTTLTNGYHPLWLLALTASWKIGREQFSLAFISLCIVCGTVLVFLLVRRLLERYLPTSPVVPLASTWCALFYCITARTGMEIVLAIPLGLAFACYVIDGSFLDSPWRCFFAGLLSALFILSRLDVGLFVGLYIAILAVQDMSFERWKRLLWFVVGWFPILAYVVINQILFGMMTPVSSTAKHMRAGLHFESTVFVTLFRPAGLVTFAFLLPAVALVLLSIATLGLRVRLWKTPWYAIVSAGVLFPVIFYTLLSLITGYRILAWYRYPLIFSSVFSVLALMGSPEPSCARVRSTLLRWPAVAGSAALCTLFTISLLKTPQGIGVLAAARDIVEFRKDHPGRYAMGDQAATPGYLLDVPMVQLEGLVMDARFLKKVRDRRPLLEVLRDYNVDYYVALDPTIQGECRTVSEPVRAGSGSPHMNATFCDPPAADYRVFGRRLDIFDVHSSRAY